jgi:hypothetical protein
MAWLGILFPNLPSFFYFPYLLFFIPHFRRHYPELPHALIPVEARLFPCNSLSRTNGTRLSVYSKMSIAVYKVYINPDLNHFGVQYDQFSPL